VKKKIYFSKTWQAIFSDCEKTLGSGDFYPTFMAQSVKEIRIIDPEFGFMGRSRNFDLGSYFFAHFK